MGWIGLTSLSLHWVYFSATSSPFPAFSLTRLEITSYLTETPFPWTRIFAPSLRDLKIDLESEEEMNEEFVDALKTVLPNLKSFELRSLFLPISLHSCAALSRLELWVSSIEGELETLISLITSLPSSNRIVNLSIVDRDSDPTLSFDLLTTCSNLFEVGKLRSLHLDAVARSEVSDEVLDGWLQQGVDMKFRFEDLD